MSFNNRECKPDPARKVPVAESAGDMYINESLLDVRDQFVHILWKRKWLILAVTVIGTVLTAAGTYLSTPLYKATTKIMVKVNANQDVLLYL